MTEYEWDHRNRLIRVTERASAAGPATQVVEYIHDYLNRWIARAVDTDGAGPLGFDDTYFVYDGTPEDVLLTDRAAVTEDNIGQIVLQFDDDAQGDPRLSHRYLWGDAVDQVLADEQVDDVSVEGDVLRALTDHLGTVRDLAEYDDSTGVTTVANHRTYDAFGALVSETNAAVDCLFGFTGRATEEFTGLQNNLNRWYDPVAGCWLTVDPIGCKAGDANLYRYVSNHPSILVDASGLYSGVWGFFQDCAHYFFDRDEMSPGLRAVDKFGIGMAAVGIGGLCGMAAAGTAGFVAAGLGASSMFQGIVGAVVGGYYGGEVAGRIGAYGGEEVEGWSRFLGGFAGSWLGWSAGGGATWGLWGGDWNIMRLQVQGGHWGWTVTRGGATVARDWWARAGVMSGMVPQIGFEQSWVWLPRGRPILNPARTLQGAGGNSCIGAAWRAFFAGWIPW